MVFAFHGGFGELPPQFLQNLDDYGHNHEDFYSFKRRLANHPRKRVQAGFLVASGKVTCSGKTFGLFHAPVSYTHLTLPTKRIV